MEIIEDTPYRPDIERAHATMHEAGFADAKLTEQDAVWLESLSGKTIDKTWLAEANEAIAVGSIDLRTDTDPLTITEVMRARERFYGVLLGWNDVNHSLYESYQNFATTNIRTMPLATVIRTQRVLRDTGIDTSKVVNASPATLGLAPESVQKKVHRITHVGKLLGYQGDTITLIETMPSILGLGNNKLLAHARLFAEHGSVELTEKQVRKFIIEALEAHIISLAQDKPYEPKYIDTVRKKYKGTERKAMVAEMLQNQPDMLEVKVGKKALRAYRRYAGV